MSVGIAVEFKKRFGRVEELLAQKTKAGGCAVLQDRERRIFYLVTKQSTSGKPTYDDLTASLKEMHKLCIKHTVTELAMPRIGCGIDGLNWTGVSQILNDVFRDSKTKITIYELPNQTSKVWATQEARKQNSNFTDIEVKCNGVQIQAQLDSGATTTMISKSAADRCQLAIYKLTENRAWQAANGSKKEIAGETIANVLFEDKMIEM